MRRPMVSAFDLVALIALMFAALSLLLVPKTKSAQIETLGLYAITLTWPKGVDADVDLWVRDPQGLITFYGNSDDSGMYLEHDDLGFPDPLNYERILLRSIVPGEYVINVHAFNLRREHDLTVTVTIWRLRGHDKKLYTQNIVLERTGTEKTAFRFRPPSRFNHLEARLVA